MRKCPPCSPPSPDTGNASRDYPKAAEMGGSDKAKAAAETEAGGSTMAAAEAAKTAAAGGGGSGKGKAKAAEMEEAPPSPESLSRSLSLMSSASDEYVNESNLDSPPTTPPTTPKSLALPLPGGRGGQNLSFLEKIFAGCFCNGADE